MAAAVFLSALTSLVTRKASSAQIRLMTFFMINLTGLDFIFEVITDKIATKIRVRRSILSIRSCRYTVYWPNLEKDRKFTTYCTVLGDIIFEEQDVNQPFVYLT